MTHEQLLFLLVVVSASATLAGIALAIYGWLNVHTADRLVSAKVAAEMENIRAQLVDQQVRSQEATQKIIAGYSLMSSGEYGRAADLFRQAVEVDPTAFNGYTALGYALLELHRDDEAIEAFFSARQQFPARHEPLNDLARVYARRGQDQLALRYIRATIDCSPDARASIESDPAFDRIRGSHPEEYTRAISGG